MAKLHEAKQSHLKEMVLMGEIPLRTGDCCQNTFHACPANFVYCNHLAS